MADRAALVIFAALLALLPLSANAGYALAKPPSGWVKSQTGATFKAPHTFPGNDGYFRTTVAVNVGGRVVDLPVGLAVAANAASFVVPAVRALPGGVLGSVALQWLAGYGIQWAAGQWMATPPAATLPQGCWRDQLAETGKCWGFEEYEAYRESLYSGWDLEPGEPVEIYGGTWYELPFKLVGTSNAYGFLYLKRALECAPGQSWNGSACVSVELVPATEQDWQSITGELPLAVAQDLAKYVPLPVALPEIVPQRVPVGSPVPKPGTVPQEYVQPVVDVVPRPTPAEPWRVELKPGEVSTTDPLGQLDTAPIGEESPVASPSDAKLDPQSLCDLYPDVLACQKLGSVESEPLPEKVVPMSIDPTSGWGEGGGFCPADRTATILGRQMAMKWTLFCDFADQVRPVVIAAAWLSAVLGFVGLSRREA